MERMIAVIFFAVAFVATVGAMACSFLPDTTWSVVCGVVALIFALAGFCFVLRDWKWNARDEKE